MGRSLPKFSYFSPPYSGEEKMLLQLDLAGKVAYLLTVTVLLLIYLQKWKRKRRGGRHVQTTNRVNVVRGDNGRKTIRGQTARRARANIARRVTSEGQYAGGFEVVGEDDGGTINGDVAMRVTMGGQYAGGFEVFAEDEAEYDGGTINGDVAMTFDVAGDDDGGTINGEIEMVPTSLAATMPF